MMARAGAFGALLLLLVAAMTGCEQRSRSAAPVAAPAAPPAAAIPAASGPVAGESEQQHVARLLRAVPLIDGHNDTPWQLRERAESHLDRIDLQDTRQLEPGMQTDLERLKLGGLGAQFWSVYVPIAQAGGEDGDVRTVIEQIDITKRMVAHYATRMELALSADDIVRIHGAGKLASLIGMEGGHSIGNSLSVLRATYALGARYMTLTHSKNLLWADSATDKPGVRGLTPFGREVVHEMNRLGMLIDLSHVSADTMRAALDTSEAPVIFSHSSAFALCQHVRNVPDDVLHKVAANGGVVMVTFLGFYVSEPLRLWAAARQVEHDRLAALPGATDAATDQALQTWTAGHAMPQATLAQVADHIDHVKQIAGIDHVGIGSDFDGTTSLPVGLEDVSKYPALLLELLRRGYSDEDLGKVMGNNLLRVLRAAEQVAARLQQQRGPSEATLADLPRYLRP